MAVGNPLGQGFSVSVGIISARQRELSGAYDDFIQTDAAINRGNSGGPLFNTLGEVIGVNTAILSPTGGSIGLGFSMSSNVVEPVVSQLKEFGQTRRGWLGVRIQDITEDTAQVLELKTLDGALVSEVPDGPAKDGGVMAGDVIVMFDNVEVSSTKELVRIVGKTAVNKSVEVVVIRKGQTKILKVILGQREIAELKAFPEKKPEEAVEKISLLGMKLSVVDDALKDEFQLDKKSEGLLVREILETSDAYGKGIRVGNLILIAAQKKLDSIDDFIDVIQKTKNVGGKSLLLLIEAEGRTRFIAVKLE
jgi:serine protease Do